MLRYVTSSKSDKGVPSIDLMDGRSNALFDGHLLSSICQLLGTRVMTSSIRGGSSSRLPGSSPTRFHLATATIFDVLVKLDIPVYITKAAIVHGVMIAFVNVLKRASRTNGKDAG